VLALRDDATSAPFLTHAQLNAVGDGDTVEWKGAL
jgi:endonuclease YncB( thermonuclease family)